MTFSLKSGRYSKPMLEVGADEPVDVALEEELLEDVGLVEPEQVGVGDQLQLGRQVEVHAEGRQDQPGLTKLAWPWILLERRSGTRLSRWTRLTPKSGICWRFQKLNGPPAKFGRRGSCRSRSRGCC